MIRDTLISRESILLKISISHLGKGGYILTGVKVSSSQWDGERVINHPQARILNNVLRNKLIYAEVVLLDLESRGELRSISLSEIKTLIKNNGNLSYKKEEEKEITIELCFDESIKLRSGKTKEIYELTRRKISKFLLSGHSNRMSDIDRAWLKRFELFCLEKNRVNTVGVHLRNIRAVFNDAIDSKTIPEGCYPFRKYSIQKETTRKRSQSAEDLVLLRDYPVEEHQEKYRDIYMLSFYLIGINMKDLLYLKGIESGRVHFRRYKTGRLYSVKVEPEALAIIDRYRGEKYLLDIMDRYVNYTDFIKRMNRELKRIGIIGVQEYRAGSSGRSVMKKKSIKPLFPYLSSYWARHTWATIASYIDIPRDVIAAGLGHGGNTVTDIYIDFDQRKVDMANRTVIDYLNGVTKDQAPSFRTSDLS